MKSVVTQRKGFAVRTQGVALPDLNRVLFMVLQVAMENAVVYWRDTYGPGHFQMGAYSKYGGREEGVYTPRYTRHRPRRLRAPLRSERPHKDYDGQIVAPGTLQRAFLGGNMRIESTGNTTANISVAATWPELPRYTYITKTAVYNRVNQGLFVKPKITKTWKPLPKKWLELTITTESEAAALGEWIAKKADELMNQAQQGQTPQSAAA